jgi:hypothetical protein
LIDFCGPSGAAARAFRKISKIGTIIAKEAFIGRRRYMAISQLYKARLNGANVDAGLPPQFQKAQQALRLQRRRLG